MKTLSCNIGAPVIQKMNGKYFVRAIQIRDAENIALTIKMAIKLKYAWFEALKI